jgi:hypothetical protein
VRLRRLAGLDAAVGKLDVLEQRLGGALRFRLGVARPAPARILHLEAERVGDNAEDAVAGHGGTRGEGPTKARRRASVKNKI